VNWPNSSSKIFFWQKQNEIDRLNAEADKKLFQQRFENAEKYWLPCRERKKFRKKNKRGLPPLLLFPNRK